MEYNKILIGTRSEIIHKVTNSDLERFVELTGDDNRLHTDVKFAAKTNFKKPVVHGMLGASILSKVFGTLFPGNGTIYLNQTLNFLRPMYVEEVYEAIFEVKELIIDKNRAIISTTISNSEGKSVLSGEATIMNTEAIH